MKWLAIELICLFSCLAQTRLQSNGTVSGSLTGEDGSNIVGGRVALLLLTAPYPARIAQQTLWTTTTGAGGSFRFGGLNSGTYKICAETANSAWLNPCEWGLRPPQVALSAAQPTASVKVVMSKGAVVPIRIDDPAHLLSQQEGKTAGAHLLVGVGTDALFFRTAPIVSSDASGRYHQIVVPFAAYAKLVVRSSFFKLSDAGGSPLSPVAVIPVTVPAGQAPTAIRVVVTGSGR